MITKAKKIGLILLTVLIVLSIASAGLLLVPKDKTTPPVFEKPKPIFEMEYTKSTDFQFVENTYSCFKVVDNMSSNPGISFVCDSETEDDGGPLFFYFGDHLPESGNRLELEFEYTMEKPAFMYAGVLLSDWPYGFDSFNELPVGSHTVKILLDGIGSDVMGPEETYPEYSLLVFVDDVQVFNFEGSIIGWNFPFSEVQGIGFSSINSNVEYKESETVITLHSLKVQVF